ncbi:MAG: VWA domain-containing protein [Spirochaetaceae bacterium]|nr:VWA domain-containing protein [Spirochaetaceae bacterium]
MAIEIEGVARKSMVMFFLIDTSGSMEGRSIAAVNDAMREVLPDIQDISNNNADAKIKLAVMSFSSGTNWETTEPQELDSYRWEDLEAGGVTEMGAAFRELNSKLDRNAFLQDPAGVKMPVIILISDGEPTDDFREGLNVLQQNKWYKRSIKVALGVDDANMDVMKEFTGSCESAIYLRDKSNLKKLIRIVSVTSSTVGSKKAGDAEDDAIAAQEAVAEIVQDEMLNFDAESAEEW